MTSSAVVTAVAEAPVAPTRPVGVAIPSGVEFRDLLSTFASREGRRCRFVPVPWHPIYWTLRLAELLPVTLPFRADSLLGFVRPAPACRAKPNSKPSAFTSSVRASSSLSGDRRKPDGRSSCLAPSMSAIVCAYTLDRWELFLASVQSLHAQTVPPLEIIVCIDHNDEMLHAPSTPTRSGERIDSGHGRRESLRGPPGFGANDCS